MSSDLVKEIIIIIIIIVNSFDVSSDLVKERVNSFDVRYLGLDRQNDMARAATL